MKKILVLILFLTVNFAMAQDASQIENSRNDANINLPVESASAADILGSEPAANSEWERFCEKYGNWQAAFGRFTGTPHRAVGTPIKIEGFNNIDKNNIQQAAMKFLRDNEKAFGIDADNLRFVRARHIRSRWYVSFVQTYAGHDVLLTEIELRIFDNGNLMAFGVDYYSGIDLNANPGITRGNAMEAATKGLAYNPKRDRTLSDGETVVLPYIKDGEVDFRLVYEVDVRTEEPIGKYKTYVDAHNGEILWRRNQVMDFNTKITASGDIKMRTPLSEPEMVQFKDMYIDVDGYKKVTDQAGLADFDNGNEVEVMFEGPWAKIKCESRTDSKLTDTITPGEDMDIVWSDDNSHLIERTLFYHTNKIHDFHKDLDPEFTAMDFQMPVSVQFKDGYTNAMSAGDQIYFLGALNPEYKFAESSSVLYHEYGHSINHFLYRQEGATGGMTNKACNEALADVTSAMLLDTPEIAKGVFADEEGKVIRNLDNDNTYPEDIVGESHHDGQILAGAFWDLREATDLETMTDLAHFARYGTPDDPNTGVSFSEWFLEVLIADDDDGNLVNGTPNSAEIIESFNIHKIGTDLFIKSSFDHLAHPDTYVTDSEYILEFELSSLPLENTSMEDIKVIYELNTGGSYEEDAAYIGDGKYKAVIPPQPTGTIVKYYFEATDKVTGRIVKLSGNFEAFRPYVFLVDFIPVVDEDFEEAMDWTIGGDDDDATYGEWEIDDPSSVDFRDYGSYLIQPGRDYSDDGSDCAVTGPEGNMQNYNRHMPNGKTTLTSPVYDLSEYSNAVLSLYHWFLNLRRTTSPNYDGELTIEVSSDGGADWNMISSHTETTKKWQRLLFVMQDYTEMTDSVRFRFTVDVFANNQGQAYTLTEALIDELQVLVPSNSSVSVAESGIVSSMNVYPNPFEENVTISFNLDEASSVLLEIYDLNAGRVAVLADEFLPAGPARYIWTGADELGNPLPAGAYYYRLGIDEKTRAGKLILE